MRHTGFEPFFDSNSRILVLGSFPSVKSRESGFYYGNGRNRFWGIVAESAGRPLPGTVEEKKALLKETGIALWDVVAECETEGSLDSSIRNYVPADLYKVLDNARIERIIINGSKAAEIFRRFWPELGELAIRLPSTSPANTSLDRSCWLSALS